MSAHFDVAAAAAVLLAARKTMLPAPTADLPGVPRHLEDVYAVQARVMDEIGPAGAFKTGRAKPGDVPVFAPIAASAVRASPAAFLGSELRLVGIELEIAFLVDAELPPLDAPDFAARARECVSAVPVIEVVDSRLADVDTVNPLWKLADNQINGGLVTGLPIKDWSLLDLESVSIDLTAGSETLASGPAKVPGGDAFDIFCACAKALGSHCGGLTPGRLVTTGSTMGLIYIEKGRTVTGEIKGLGRVQVTV